MVINWYAINDIGEQMTYFKFQEDDSTIMGILWITCAKVKIKLIALLCIERESFAIICRFEVLLSN